MYKAPLAKKKHPKTIRHTFDALVALEEARRKRESTQLTVGSLLEFLRTAEPTANIVFDRNSGSPTDPHSYHGYFEDLAFDYDTNKIITVDDMIHLLESCIGQLFQQFQKDQGHYQMCTETPLWLSHSGCHGWKIVGVEFSSALVTLLTEQHVDGFNMRDSSSIPHKPCSGCELESSWNKIF